MKVYAVRMRKEGQKLPKRSVQLAVPTVGYLSLIDGRTLDTNKPCLWAWLNETEEHTSKMLFPALRPAWIKKINGPQLIVVGYERIGEPKWQREWPQAWWCRLGGFY